MSGPCWHDELDSPVGTLRLVADDDGLRYIAFEYERHPIPFSPSWTRAPASSALFTDVKAQLREYFAGARQRFELPLSPRGTEFQLRVWRALEDIPYGATVTYRDIAERLGKPTATRAVGAANGRNPLPIVIPCHRVIGADGSLTGFGGGIAVKRKLLTLEGALATSDLFAGLTPPSTG